MKKVLFGVALLIVVVLGVGSYFIFNGTQNQSATSDGKTSSEVPSTKKSSEKETTDVEESPNLPTIFVHGYSGGKNSFGGMIDRLTREKSGTKSLVATIQGDGTITYEGNYQADTHHPMIQVLFVENMSTEENQSWWIKELLLSLKKNYNIQELNAVGHSMGGVSLVNAITSMGTDSQYPKINKLVSIGAPINGLEIGTDGVTDFDLTPDGPKTVTERYQNFMNLKANIPTTLEVLSIAGDKEDGTKSDGSVSVASALSTKFIFEGQAKSYQELTFTGANAAHSMLHENTAVDKAVANFLWNDKE